MAGRYALEGSRLEKGANQALWVAVEISSVDCCACQLQAQRDGTVWLRAVSASMRPERRRPGGTVKRGE